MHRLIDLCLRYRFLVLALTILAAVLGIASLRRLTIDAVPDITPVQVQVLTRSPALGPVAVERYVPFPPAPVLSGTCRLFLFFSGARYPLAAVTIIFED